MFRIIARRRIHCFLKDYLTLFLLSWKGEVLQGSNISDFESRFADFFGVKHAICVSSGREGLCLILESLGLQKHDEILLPAFTFSAVPKVVVECGFKPVFVDIERNSYNIDLNGIEQNINERTMAIIATHIFGCPCEIEKVMQIANKYKLAVIEDCAQAIGAVHKGKRVGSYGSAGFFSFESVKPFNTFGGGMVVTNDHDLAVEIRKMVLRRPYPSKKNIYKRFIFTFLEHIVSLPLVFSVFIYPVLLLCGGNLARPFRRIKSRIKTFGTRFTNLQAIIGISRLDKLEIYNSKRIAFAQYLGELLKDKCKLQLVKECDGSAYYNYVIESNFPDKLCRKLLFRGIDTDRFLNYDCSNFFQAETSYPNAVNAVKKLVQVPLYGQLSKKDIEYIALALLQSANSGNG